MIKLIGIILCTIVISCASISKKQVNDNKEIAYCTQEYVEMGAPLIFAATICKCIVNSDYLNLKNRIEQDLVLLACTEMAKKKLREEQQKPIIL